MSDVWFDLSNHYFHVKLDQFVIMPNHFHGIVMLDRDNGVGTGVGAGLKPAPTPTKIHALRKSFAVLKHFHHAVSTKCAIPPE